MALLKCIAGRVPRSIRIVNWSEDDILIWNEMGNGKREKW